MNPGWEHPNFYYWNDPYAFPYLRPNWQNLFCQPESHLAEGAFNQQKTGQIKQVVKREESEKESEQQVSPVVCLKIEQEHLPNFTNFENLTRRDIMELKASYRKVKWSESDDQKLIELVSQNRYTWVEISLQFPNTTEKMCSTRFKRLQKNGKKYWTRKEDRIIQETVAQIGQKWKEISFFVPNRTPKQIREHYINMLRPQIRKGAWTTQQDMKLADLVQEYGHRWRLFESQLVGRTENHIKNRFYGRIKKIKDIKRKEGINEIDRI